MGWTRGARSDLIYFFDVDLIAFASTDSVGKSLSLFGVAIEMQL